MTYSRLSILCFILALITGVIFVKMNSGFSQEIGQCVKRAEYIYNREIGFGKKMRLVIGWKSEDDKKHSKLHEWAEYWNEDRQKWCLWDGTDWRIYKSWYTAEESKYITYRTFVPK